MAFPFTIDYSKPSKGNLQEMKWWRRFFILIGLSGIKKPKMCVLQRIVCLIKVRHLPLIGTVDKGEFKITDDGDKGVSMYEIFIYHHIIFVSAIAILSGLIEMSFWPPIIFLTMLGGITWLIEFARHGGMFDEIKTEIDTLLTTGQTHL